MHAPAQFVQDILVPQVQVRKHHQGVKPQVGRFVHQVGRVAGAGILGRNNGLGRFLADFLENLVQPLVIQAGDLGFFRRGSAALAQHGVHFFQYLFHNYFLSPYICPGSFSTGSVISQRPSSR